MVTAKSANSPRLSPFLRMAIIAGVESAVHLHIVRGDNLNACDAGGMTPLMLAAARNKPAICRMLLDAGVDPDLIDPAGRTAFAIAVATGAHECAGILTATPAISSGTLEPSVVQATEPEQAATPDLASSITSLVMPMGTQPTLEQADSIAGEGACIAATTVGTVDQADAIELDDEGGFDLSDWEAETEAQPPDADLVVLHAVSAIQTAITVHEPIDSSTDWDEIEIYLPEQALPLARANDNEGRASLRLLLLRAIREGSIPSLDVQAHSISEDGSASTEASAYLIMIVNDLGSEVDERFEYSNGAENFEVFVDPVESPEEEATLDAAMDAIDRAATPRHQPLQIYQREFQRIRLLTAEKEIQLGKDMEAAIEAAISALATWPDGIARTLAAGAEALAGSRPLSSIWLGGADPDPEPASADTLTSDASQSESSEDSMLDDGKSKDESSTSPSSVSLSASLDRLRALVEASAHPQEVRHTLMGLGLNRRFLLELGDAANSMLSPCPDFGHALAALCQARDSMATANLKLAFFHAKKYLYSGEPLDDLAQEGNIGLLKAVDRFDWRKGFRFSTYATWWIRQQISRYVANKVRTIRLPAHLHEQVQRMERAAEGFEKLNNRAPTLAELTNHFDIQESKIESLMRISSDILRIDDLHIDEMIAIDARDSFTLPAPDELIESSQLRTHVNNLLSSLKKKEAQVIRLRFGIGISEALTLEDVGLRFEVTRERIRQIEAKAIQKLKNPARTGLSQASMDNIRPAIAPSVEEEKNPELPDSASTHAQETKLQEAEQLDGEITISDLDAILLNASELGLHVEDDRSGSSGRIWINLIETPDQAHIRLAWKLIEAGFKCWPDKGYWR